MGEILPYFIELRMIFNVTYNGIASREGQLRDAIRNFPIRADGVETKTITKEALEYEVESRYKLYDEEILNAVRTQFASTWSEDDETLLRK